MQVLNYMYKLNQKGVIQLAVVLILVAGLVSSVYLVNRPEMLKLFPKAFNSSTKRSLSVPIPSPTPVPRPVSGPCIQVVTPAKNSAGECREFPTPCDVPAGWKKVDKCPFPTPMPLSCSACNADLNKDGIVNNSDIAKINNCVTGKIKGSACLNMDFDANGKIDQVDLQCVRKVYNQKCTTKKR